MAIPLPYPNMSFVPLDILTAEEMNHIVANYTYIANYLPNTGVPFITMTTTDPGEGVDLAANNFICVYTTE